MGERVAFLCLGSMGGPMAGHLAAAGHDVVVYNRSDGRAEAFVAEHGGRQAATPAEAVAGAGFVFACTGDDPDLRQITLGDDGAFAAMEPGSVFVDHTTASAEVAQELAMRAAAAGFAALDAPVSGGEDGARRGALTVMVGGDEAAFARAEPLIRHFAREVVWMGPAGSGQRTKMVNQVCIAGLLQGLSEGIALAERIGLDPKRVIQVISKGAAQSWQMDNRAETMIDGRFDFGFAVDWMRKDLRIALEEARCRGARLPVAALVDQLYAAVQEGGGGRLDTSSLVTLLRGRATQRSPFAEAEEVLDFWFGDAATDPAKAIERARFWFAPDPATDGVIRERFRALVERAARGELDGWAAEPRAALARVILLDQFPRNMDRGTAEAFQYDALALAAAEQALADRHAQALPTLFETFLLVPFMHAESLSAQERGVAEFASLLGRAEPGWRPNVEVNLDYAREHRDLLARFGRFPYRNAVLGRESTAEEEAYLAAGGETFGQGGSAGR